MGELGNGVIEWQKDGIALTAEQKRLLSPFSFIQ